MRNRNKAQPQHNRFKCSRQDKIAQLTKENQNLKALLDEAQVELTKQKKQEEQPNTYPTIHSVGTYIARAHKDSPELAIAQSIARPGMYKFVLSELVQLLERNNFLEWTIEPSPICPITTRRVAQFYVVKPEDYKEYISRNPDSTLVKKVRERTIK